MKVSKLILGFFNVNCYIVEINSSCFIIDPGADFIAIERFITKEKLKPEFILNTHGHYDHIGAVPELLYKYKIPFIIHKADEFIITDPNKNLSTIFGNNSLALRDYKLIGNVNKSVNKNNFKNIGLNEKIIKDINSLISKDISKNLEIFNMPGHTPGSIVIKLNNFLFTGDLLFKDGVGRTDLPGGNSSELIESLRLIKQFDPEMIVYPGHGATTKLKFEIENNYYLSEHFLEGGKLWL